VTDPGYQAWFDSVTSFGNVPPEEIVRRSFAPRPEVAKEEVRELCGVRVIALIAAPCTEDDPSNAAILAKDGQLFLETVEGVHIGAPSREALEERREGVLLGKAHEREELRTAAGSLLARLGQPASPQTGRVCSTSAKPSQVEPPCPRWAKAKRQLWYGSILCVQYKRPAPLQHLLLDAFQEMGWPECIDDPLPRGKRAQTIGDLQRLLRRNNSPLIIERDGKGTGFSWRVASDT
jgi:hypothetical protein